MNAAQEKGCPVGPAPPSHPAGVCPALPPGPPACSCQCSSGAGPTQDTHPVAGEAKVHGGDQQGGNARLALASHTGPNLNTNTWFFMRVKKRWSNSHSASKKIKPRLPAITHLRQENTHVYTHTHTRSSACAASRPALVATLCCLHIPLQM